MYYNIVHVYCIHVLYYSTCILYTCINVVYYFMQENYSCKRHFSSQVSLYNPELNYCQIAHMKINNSFMCVAMYCITIIIIVSDMYCRDHAGGNEKLVTLMSNLTVCGNDDRIGAMNKIVKNKDTLKVHTSGQV